MLYNPAFTGNVDLGRFALSYRNQWPGIPGKFVSYAASYEHYLSDLKSGLGVQFISDKAGSGGLTTQGVNLLYSYQIQLSRRVALMAGIKGGYYSRRYDFQKFTFADQIARDNAPESLVDDFREQATYPNFGQGLVLYHLEKYWFGISFDHLNQPNIGFTDPDATLPIRTAIQGGWNFDVNQNFNGRARDRLTVAALYKAQAKWDQLDIGVYYKMEPLLLGLWYRGLPLKKNQSSLPNYDAMMLMTGFRFDRITVAYSYDITISSLSWNTAGSHEISITLDYPKPKRRRRRFFNIPCPKF